MACGVELVEQTSRSLCIRNFSFGCLNRTTIWASECRGRFQCAGGDAFDVCVLLAGTNDLLRREVELLRLMTHPNASGLQGTFERPGELQLILDLCRGGDLDSGRPPILRLGTRGPGSAQVEAKRAPISVRG